jgi:hypothetical protein
MNRLLPLLVSTLVAVGALSSCVSAQRDPRQLNETTANDLATQGTSQFGIQWEGRAVGASERGVVAVTDGVTTFTTRAGARVFVIHNRKAFPPGEAMTFAGSDDDLKNIGMKLLRGSGAREDEVADAQVLQQFTQVGQAGSSGQAVNVTPPQRSHRTLLVSRRLQGVDVVSSRLLLNVDRSGRPAFMELAWPDIGADVLERALRYKAFAASTFVAPRLEGADVESVQPVILHSPAIGFYNDATAAIRVIYRPTAAQVGQKPVRYLDDRGVDVPLPRDIDRVREDPVKRADTKK